jgi:hypothetical protein
MRYSEQPNGFSLVEVAFALAVAVFCLVTIMGLLPVALNSGRATAGETAANVILNEVVADLRATGPTSPPGVTGATSQQFQIAIPATGATSQPQTLYFTPLGVSSSPANSTYRLTVTFPITAGRAATIAIAKVSWPAPATNPSGIVESFVALDRN